MPTIGRNAPCPCGSGKKYKKCCLAKDEQRAREEAAALAASTPAQPRPSESAPGRAAPDLPPPPPLTPEELAAREVWKRFEAADYEGRIGIFLATLEAGAMDGELAFEMLDSLWTMARDPIEQERFRGLVARLRRDAPEAYEDQAHYFSRFILDDVVPAGKTELVQELLEPFVRDPGRSIDSFFQVIDLLMYYGQTGALLDAMARAWPALEAAPGVIYSGKEEFVDAALRLALFAHLDEGGVPTAEDPTLRAALSAFPITNWERVGQDLLILSGRETRDWKPADFGAGTGKGKRKESTVGRNLVALSDEWLADLRWSRAVPFSRGELARAALVGYQWEQVEEDRLALKVLVPERKLLDRYIGQRFFHFLGHQTHEAASLMELLPLYLQFLVQRGLLGEEEAKSTLRSLHPLQRDLCKVLKRERDPNLAGAVERAWQQAIEVR